MAETRASAQRPLSPHLFIYKPTLTMTMSIVHRITGGGLYFGTLLVAWWLIAAATSPNAYAGIGSFMSSFFGRLILFGYTWALMHHMLGGPPLSLISVTKDPPGRRSMSTTLHFVGAGFLAGDYI